MMELELRRRFFAEELEAVCKLRTPALVDAFARVRRDEFLPPGPWTVLSDSGESYMMGAGVRTRVTPEYPALAKQMNVTGKVKLEATVAVDGHVVSTRVVGGSPLLVNSAIEALKKWRFEPAAKETTEVVEFTFSGQDQ